MKSQLRDKIWDILQDEFNLAVSGHNAKQRSQSAYDRITDAINRLSPPAFDPQVIPPIRVHVQALLPDGGSRIVSELVTFPSHRRLNDRYGVLVGTVELNEDQARHLAGDPVPKPELVVGKDTTRQELVTFLESDEVLNEEVLTRLWVKVWRWAKKR